jgi:transposase
MKKDSSKQAKTQKHPEAKSKKSGAKGKPAGVKRGAQQPAGQLTAEDIFSPRKRKDSQIPGVWEQKALMGREAIEAIVSGEAGTGGAGMDANRNSFLEHGIDIDKMVREAVAKKLAEAMQQTIGIDLGDKTSEYCILDGNGEVVRRASVATEREAFQAVFGKMAPCRIAIEVGTHSPWVSELLKGMGHEVIVANPRQVKLIHGGANKSDKIDAEKLGRLARFDPKLLKGIQHRGPEAQGDLMLVRARAQTIETRTSLINTARGLMKSRGGRLASCSTAHFGVELLEGADQATVEALKPVVEIVEKMTEAIKGYDRQIEELSKKYADAIQLQQVAGVGPVIAVTFVLTIEDPWRFKKSRDVGGYVGLTAGQWESGNSKPQKGITKAGDGYLRSLLVQGAHYILGPHGPDTDLRRWGLQMTERGGKRSKKRAVVAVARKLAVLLLVLWKSGKSYEPLRNSNAGQAVA